MNPIRHRRIYKIYLCFLSTVGLSAITTALTSNSACFGNVATNATKMYLTCQSGSTIELTSVTAGAKATSTGCPSSFSDAMTQDIACCSPSTNTADDCTFALADTTNFVQSCNGQQSCEPEAKNVDATGQCDMTFPATTLFMFIDYQCISAPSTSEDIEPAPSSSADSDSDNLNVILLAVLIPFGVILIGLIIAASFASKKYISVNKKRKTVPCDINANDATDSGKLQQNLTREQTADTVREEHIADKVRQEHTTVTVSQENTADTEHTADTAREDNTVRQDHTAVTVSNVNLNQSNVTLGINTQY